MKIQNISTKKPFFMGVSINLPKNILKRIPEPLISGMNEASEKKGYDIVINAVGDNKVFMALKDKAGENLVSGTSPMFKLKKRLEFFANTVLPWSEVEKWLKK